MMGRGGSDRSYRIEEKGRHSGWGIAPSSRHLWVGNLASHVTESVLFQHFIRFGEVQDIVLNSGRSYAFVNFKKEEDAIIACKELQGVVVEGAPLRIEFAKGDRHAMSAQEEDCQWGNDDSHLVQHSVSHLHRDARPYRSSPKRTHDKGRGDQNAEPNEELWIGFPSTLVVDEVALGRAFSPFGTIDNITSFPGRNYAFVRFKSIIEAYRAKEALQGKLFNNPRISICFAKNDFSSGAHGKATGSHPLPLHLNANFHQGGSSAEILQMDKSFDGPNMRSPLYDPNLKKMPVDSMDLIHGRNIPDRTGSAVRPCLVGAFDMTSQRRMSGDVYGCYRGSPGIEEGIHQHDLPLARHHRSPHLEDSWDMDDDYFPVQKKLRTDTLPQREHAEHPLSGMKEEKSDTRSMFFSGLHEPQNFSRNKSLTFEHEGFSDHSNILTHAHIENNDWRTTEQFNIARNNQQRINSESYKHPLNEEWKWEGTIAKGGTPICRARCFPVRKSPDFMLPDFLNCTARTSINMLAKHYYQASCAWIVFFVAQSDSDMAFYNEFMHYLEEKQRAAVAKLGEKMSLFLVPPSEFSERVLKVPGKLSISGVILKFQQPNTELGSLIHPLETVESNGPSVMHMTTRNNLLVEDIPFRLPAQPSVFKDPLQANHTLPASKPSEKYLISGPLHSIGKVTEFRDGEYDALLHQGFSQSNSSNHLHNSNSSIRSNSHPHISDRYILEEHPLANSTYAQESVSLNFVPSDPNNVPIPVSTFPPQFETATEATPSVSIPLQHEQLSQLAAILGQQTHFEKEAVLPMSGANKQPVLVQNSTAQTHVSMPFSSIVSPQPVVPLSSLGSRMSQGVGSQPSQQHEGINHSSVVPIQGMQQANQLVQSSTLPEADADPQKRLQATLQLAATLLQQIQQQTKPTDKN